MGVVYAVESYFNTQRLHKSRQSTVNLVEAKNSLASVATTKTLHHSVYVICKQRTLYIDSPLKRIVQQSLHGGEPGRLLS